MSNIIAKQIIDELGVVFKTVKFRNFMSFGNLWTEINLEGSGTTFINGENIDDGGSSGAGKSTLINAISYCLYDKIPSSVSKDRLINRTNDKKITQMEVILTFSKGKDVYTVKRWRGGATGCQLLLNDQDITPASVNRGEDSFNARVEDILGFSYNLFSQIILFNGNSQPFLDIPVSSQRALIEELFRITMLSRKAVELKKRISDSEKSISMQKLLIQQQQKQNEIHKTHLDQARNRVKQWDEIYRQELSTIQKSIEIFESIDYDGQELLFSEISKVNDAIAHEQNRIAGARGVHEAHIRELQSQKNSREREIPNDQSNLTIAKSELLKLKKDFSLIEKELNHLRDSKCPYCLQQMSDAPKKILDLESQESNLSISIKKNEEDIAIFEKTILLFREVQSHDVKSFDDKIKIQQSLNYNKPDELLQRKLDDLAELKSALIYPNLNALLKNKNELEVLQNRLEKMVVETNPHIEAYEVLALEGDVKVDVEALEALNKLQEHQQFLLKLLTDKNSFIRKNIISKTIPFLNKRIAYYTEKLNLPHIVIFQSDMTCEITQIGRDLDHGNLSNGEKKKLNLSLCLAFRDVLTYLHSKVNVLFTDEIDGGSLSGGDIDSLVTMLKSKAWDDDIAIFIISHRPEFEGRCDNNLIIRKENGFSTLILQPEY
jgi:DNA repair exonuclease SbcCD ATPase subunit